MVQAVILFLVLLWSGVCEAAPMQPPEPAMGVTAESGGTRVRVWAPHATSVSVIGDFNNWKAMGTEKLAPEGNTGIWSTLLKRSIPKHGGYRFLINGDLQRRDPYARSTAPDGGMSLFYNPGAFNWTGDRAPVYALDELVIYEMHIGAFNDANPADGRGATFEDATKRLDYLNELGVNVVQLMPVHEFSGAHSWGYNPSDLFSVEQAYGGPDAFKAFVKECHRRGLAVHVDIVHNHYDQEKASVLQFDGTGQPHGGGIYFYNDAERAQTPWGPRPDFDEKMVRRFIRDNAMMWLEEYRVDGFRWDSTVNIRAYNNGRTPLPAGAKMLEDINNEIKKRHTNVFSIAEDSLDIGNFHASWDYDFHNTVMPEFKKRDADRDLRPIQRVLTSRPTMGRVIYVDNHDEAGKLNGQTRFASDVDPDNPGSVRARQLSGLAAALVMTTPGIPLMLMGNEFLQPGSFHENQPLDWSRRQKFSGLVDLNRDLIHLRRNLGGAGNALKGAGIDIQIADHTKKILAYWRWHERSPSDRMVIAMNFSGQVQTNISLLFPSDGLWVPRINSDWTRYGGDTRENTAPFRLSGGTLRLNVTLAPYSVQIFSVKGTGDATPRPSWETPRPERDTAPAAPPAPPVRVENVQFDSIALMGLDPTNRPLSWPLKQIGPVHWEGFVQFHALNDGALWLSANADGKTYWGQAYDTLDRIPYHTKADRMGSDMQIGIPLDGTYRVRFNAQTRDFLMESAPNAQPSTTAAPMADELRTWTDLRGNTIAAKLIEVRETTIVLQKANGVSAEVPLNALIPEDQDVARKQATRQTP